MTCFSHHSEGTALDHRWHWIYPYEKKNRTTCFVFSGTEIYTKINHSTKYVKTTASFTHTLKR